jgi:hypothetical protein
MALMTLALVAALGIRRYLAVQQRTVNNKFYRTFEGEGEPESLRKHTRNVQNQFELPPLFHLAVWGTYAAGAVTPLAVWAAWLFVASRAAHSAIHLGYNTVLHRFLVYGVGLIAVAVLWMRLLVTLSSRVV